MAKDGDMKVWWIPQVPGKRFEVSVESAIEAKMILETLERYDAFQLENRIKPDYCNAGGLIVFIEEEGGWVDWCDDDGNDIGDCTMDELLKSACG